MKTSTLLAHVIYETYGPDAVQELLDEGWIKRMFRGETSAMREKSMRKKAKAHGSRLAVQGYDEAEQTNRRGSNERATDLLGRAAEWHSGHKPDRLRAFAFKGKRK